MEVELLTQSTPFTRLGDYLIEQLNDSEWTIFRAAIAFVRRSGMRHIRESLRHRATQSTVKITAGIDLKGTSYEGLLDLLNAMDGHGQVFVFHNENPFTFHPKVYLFRNHERARVIIGSGNLTEGGLFTNYESSVAVKLNLGDLAGQHFLAHVEAMLDGWCNEDSQTCMALNLELLERLREAGYLESEAEQSQHRREGSGDGDSGTPGRSVEDMLFPRTQVRAAPRLQSVISTDTHVPSDITETPLHVTGFMMTLQQTDAGTGQTSPGTSRRSPEIFIPLSARDQHPAFWGWPDRFSEDSARPGNRERVNVPMRMGTEDFKATIWYYGVKHEFRLRHERLRSAGDVGDILRIQRIPEGSEVEYSVDVIRADAPQYSACLARCNNQTPNSRKQWGYY